MININEEKIDLKLLALVADGAFEAEVNRMTEGMVREDEFLGFLKRLKGQWRSSRKRMRYLDAGELQVQLIILLFYEYTYVVVKHNSNIRTGIASVEVFLEWKMPSI